MIACCSEMKVVREGRLLDIRDLGDIRAEVLPFIQLRERLHVGVSGVLHSLEYSPHRSTLLCPYCLYIRYLTPSKAK